jgi:hypothetical protein
MPAARGAGQEDGDLGVLEPDLPLDRAMKWL